MWWDNIKELRARLAELIPADGLFVDPSALVEPGSILDTSSGPICIGPRSRICSGAVLKGPVIIGEDCLIGNNAMVRGPTLIRDEVRIGFTCEIKQALIGNRVSLGPMCYVADSQVDEDVYLGAMVRTSNHRLDRQPVAVHRNGKIISTGCEKLGCHIGAGATLGIQVIILPGREIAPGSSFEPRITVSRNLPAGQYRLRQEVELV